MHACKLLFLSFFFSANNFGTTTAAQDCAQLYREKVTRDGVYEVTPANGNVSSVYCDMTTDGGGWTVFQRRTDGVVDFFRNYLDYVRGFGDVLGSHWLGLKAIHKLSEEPQQLRVDMEGCENDAGYAKYADFMVGNGAGGYQLAIGSYVEGNMTGDSMAHHNGMKFTTFDNDQDDHPSNCAIIYEGGFWYGSCLSVNHNGPYPSVGSCIVPTAMGLTWYHWKEHAYSALKTKWMMRPMNFQSAQRRFSATLACLEQNMVTGKAKSMVFAPKRKGGRLSAPGMWVICSDKESAVYAETYGRCAFHCFQSGHCAGYVFKKVKKQCGFYSVSEVAGSSEVADEGYDLYLKVN